MCQQDEPFYCTVSPTTVDEHLATLVGSTVGVNKMNPSIVLVSPTTVDEHLATLVGSTVYVNKMNPSIVLVSPTTVDEHLATLVGSTVCVNKMNPSISPTTVDEHVKEARMFPVVVGVDLRSLQDVFYHRVGVETALTQTFLVSATIEGHQKYIARLKVRVL